MKKILSLIIVFIVVLLPSITVSATANNTMSDNINLYDELVYSQICSEDSNMLSLEKATNIENTMVLFSFYEEPIAIFYKLSPHGFAILDFNNKILLEYSTDYDHPFLALQASLWVRNARKSCNYATFPHFTFCSEVECGYQSIPGTPYPSCSVCF